MRCRDLSPFGVARRASKLAASSANNCQPQHVGLELAGDGAHLEGARDQLQVEIARAHVGEELRVIAERILQPDIAADDAAAEHLRFEVAVEGQHVVLEPHSGNARGNCAGELRPAKCLRQQRHADGLDLTLEGHFHVGRAKIAHDEIFDGKRAIEDR